MLKPNEIEKLMDLTVADILQTYSGKPGCACGCRGKYTVNPAYKQRADQERGYEQPAGRINVISQVLAKFKANSNHPAMSLYDNIFAFDLSDVRTYTIYLK